MAIEAIFFHFFFRFLQKFQKFVVSLQRVRLYMFNLSLSPSMRRAAFVYGGGQLWLKNITLLSEGSEQKCSLHYFYQAHFFIKSSTNIVCKNIFCHHQKTVYFCVCVTFLPLSSKKSKMETSISLDLTKRYMYADFLSPSNKKKDSHWKLSIF